MRYDDLKKMFPPKKAEREIPRYGSGGAYIPTPEQLEIILSERSVKEIQEHLYISREIVKQIRNSHGIFLTRGGKRISNCGETL
jgi:DeoR/GlpR family transcriptional regulator of sugar metabolism